MLRAVRPQLEVRRSWNRAAEGRLSGTRTRRAGSCGRKCSRTLRQLQRDQYIT